MPTLPQRQSASIAAWPHRAWPAPETAAAAAVALAPLLWLATLAFEGELGVRPVHEAIRASGDWALRLFWLTLAVSPARRILAAPRLFRARRVLGLGSLGLTVLHIGLYAFELEFDWATIAGEILFRLYLAIGAIASVVLVALGATSNDRAVARLGSGRWNALHRLSYPAAALALAHFLLRSRINTFEPMLMFGLLAWLMGVRLIQRFAGQPTPATLAALALACAVATAAAEIAWHATATGVDPLRVLSADLDFSYGVRPAWWVLIAGLGVAIAGSLRMSPPPRRGAATPLGQQPALRIRAGA
jgi:methionine sulfoxide reductase heme-binding subunit